MDGPLGAFINYVDKKRWEGSPKKIWLFVNVHKVENVNVSG